MKKIGTPLPFLNDWLKQETFRCIDKNKTYMNPLIRKNFIDNSLQITPILRIFKFLKISKTKGITAILADSKHQILANFPLIPTVTSFETKYRQRITYETTHCLILIRQANLVFTSRAELEEDYGIYFNNNLDIMTLEILDLEIFGRDKMVLGQGIEKNLRFLYDDDDYDILCQSGNSNFYYEKYCGTESI